ncbi:MAG: hypothetical protein U0271_46755 [Polyangiaceae bacterium]
MAAGSLVACDASVPSESHEDSTENPETAAAQTSTGARRPLELFARTLPQADVALVEAGTGSGFVPAASDDESPVDLKVAAGGVFLRDRATGVAATFRLVGPSGSSSRIEGGLAVFEDDTDGSAQIVRARGDGVEDFVVVPEPRDHGSISYVLDLEQASALRLVGANLEVLDAEGAPRLRVQAPYVIDATGARHAASISVSDCAIDTDPTVPWHRPVRALDSSRCTMSVSYDESLPHPVLVDPEWLVSASMHFARTHHTATLLNSGDVLVIGGFDVTGAPVPEIEVLCPETTCSGGPTFTQAPGQLAVARGAHTATGISSNTQVIVTGGRTQRVGGTALASTEIYDVATGLVSAGPSMSVGRWGHTATLLPTGSVLVAGGEDNTSGSTAELYTPGGNFGAPIAMTEHRRGHVAETVTISSATQVLIAGGIGSLNNLAVASAELFNPATSSFAFVGNMTSQRAWATATQIEDAAGSVLIAGGTNNAGFYYPTADLFVPNGSGGTFQQQTLAMQRSRAFHTATKLIGQGKILITGGTNGSQVRAETEVFQVGASSSALASTMKAARDFHTATLLPSGKVAVVGGGVDGTPAAPDSGVVNVAAAISSEVLYRSNGEFCENNGECASDHCYKKSMSVTGVCCDDNCKDVCSSCFAADQAAPAPGDGTCAIVLDNTPIRPQCVSAVQLTLQCVAGIVEAAQVTSCGAYKCLDQERCRLACSGSNDDHCNTGYYCDQTVCREQLTPGEECSRDGECKSLHCVDGVCCDLPCDGQCQACDVEGFVGKCSQVEGAPHPNNGTRSECSGAGTECEGVCGSNPTHCDYDQTVECGDSTCVDGQRSFGRCSKEVDGVCGTANEDCGAFRCDDAGEACTTSCTTAADCSPNAACREKECVKVESPECDGDHTIIRPDDTTKDCSPFKCGEAGCFTTCRSVDDCVDGKVCDESGACIDPPPDPTAPDDGCSIGARPTSESARGPLGLLLVAMGLIASRVRRKEASR